MKKKMKDIFAEREIALLKNRINQIVSPGVMKHNGMNEDLVIGSLMNTQLQYPDKSLFEILEDEKLAYYKHARSADECFTLGLSLSDPDNEAEEQQRYKLQKSIIGNFKETHEINYDCDPDSDFPLASYLKTLENNWDDEDDLDQHTKWLTDMLDLVKELKTKLFPHPNSNK